VTEHEADAPAPTGVHRGASSDPTEADQAIVAAPPGVIGAPAPSSTVAVHVDVAPIDTAPHVTVVDVARW
jgi:hypothetical protein